MSYTTFQDIQKTYITECEASETKSLGKTRLRSNLKRLCDLGIVEMGKEGNGTTGRLTFSIPDVPVEAVVEWGSVRGSKCNYYFLDTRGVGVFIVENQLLTSVTDERLVSSEAVTALGVLGTIFVIILLIVLRNYI